MFGCGRVELYVGAYIHAVGRTVSMWGGGGGRFGGRDAEQP